MVIPMQKSRFNVLHISDDDENDDGPFAKPKTRKAARPAANTTKPKKTVDVPFLVPNQPKKSRAKKPARSKQEKVQLNSSQEKNEGQNFNDEACDVDDVNDEDFNKALRESEESYQLEKMVRDTSIMEDDGADGPPLTRRGKADEKKSKEHFKSRHVELEIPQTMSDVASILTRVKLVSETQEYFDAAQFDSSHYEEILAKKDIEIQQHKSSAEKYKARFRRVLALINECEYKDVAELSIECDQLKKSIAEYIKIQEELMSQVSEANKEIEQLKSRNHDLEKEYSRKYQSKS